MSHCKSFGVAEPGGIGDVLERGPQEYAPTTLQEQKKKRLRGRRKIEEEKSRKQKKRMSAFAGGSGGGSGGGGTKEVKKDKDEENFFNLLEESYDARVDQDDYFDDEKAKQRQLSFNEEKMWQNRARINWEVLMAKREMSLHPLVSTALPSKFLAGRKKIS